MSWLKAGCQDLGAAGKGTGGWESRQCPTLPLLPWAEDPEADSCDEVAWSLEAWREELSCQGSHPFALS